MSKRGKTGLRKGKPKAGLTPAEKARVESVIKAASDFWKALLARNKWRPTP